MTRPLRAILRCFVIPREPDFIIGGAARPYLRRWWVIPRNPFFNVYLHHVVRDDDDRALHDHPWWNCSILLAGRLREVVLDGSVKPLRRFVPVFRGAQQFHRLVVEPGCAWTLFITGPRVREWGFLCASGWRHWREFTDPAEGGATVGRGCD